MFVGGGSQSFGCGNAGRGVGFASGRYNCADYAVGFLCAGIAGFAVGCGSGAYFAGLFFGSGSAVGGSRAGGWPACFGSVGVGHWHGADWFVANAGGFAGGFGYCGSVGFATGGYVFPFCSGG